MYYINYYYLHIRLSEHASTVDEKFCKNYYTFWDERKLAILKMRDLFWLMGGYQAAIQITTEETVTKLHHYELTAWQNQQPDERH